MRYLLYLVCLFLPVVCAAQELPVAPNIRTEKMKQKEALPGAIYPGQVKTPYSFSDAISRSLYESAPITVQFPAEDEEIPKGSKIVSLRGQVRDMTGVQNVTVNGTVAKLEADGRFQATVPIQPGRFALLVQTNKLVNGTDKNGHKGQRYEPIWSVVRHIQVAGKSPAPPLEEVSNKIAEIKEGEVRLRTSSATSDNLSPSQVACGKILITGRKGTMCRVALGEGEVAWIESSSLSSDLEDLPSATDSCSVKQQITDINLSSEPGLTRFEVGISNPVSLFLQEYNNSLVLKFYYSCGFAEQVGVLQDSLVQNVTWSESDNSIAFTLNFRKGKLPWGYDYHFADGKFVLELYHQPVFKQVGSSKPLKGIHILLDPGHSSDQPGGFDGTVGASGYCEYEANLDLALDLKKELESAGAYVTLTRYDNLEQVSLQNRKAISAQVRPDVMVSLHYDALAANVDPAKAGKQGYSVLYSYPHSKELARHIYQSYKRNVSALPGRGINERTDLFVTRISYQPTVLIESAFLSQPDQEDMAKSPKGRAVFVRAIKEGLESFFTDIKSK